MWREKIRTWNTFAPVGAVAAGNLIFKFFLTLIRSGRVMGLSVSRFSFSAVFLRASVGCSWAGFSPNGSQPTSRGEIESTGGTAVRGSAYTHVTLRGAHIKSH